MFQNPEITLEDLPDTDAVQWLTLDPAFRRLRQLQAALIIIAALVPVVAIIIGAQLSLLQAAVIAILWAIVGTALLLWPVLALPKRGYVVRDKDILFRQGLVWRSVTAVPFNRIQHVETSSTPFDRKFALATLQLFTAGGSSGDLKIDGLAAATAEQIRIYILAKAGVSIENN
jgi:membrane protein YdbS with pleckstrin-like domain